ncbi:sterol desaturase family protein [Paludibacterium yongneupense]|uniref:sterol desaturase family protein n=1 Tax=Paludibacterium yongneupense TaxID=400061 RepID=UPI00041FE231|nr:sterol desaturase family protein [Paludibacterium yongneupense]
MSIAPDSLLLALAPVFIASMAAEYWLLRRRGLDERYAMRDTACNIALALAQQASDKAAWFATLPLFACLHQHRLWHIDAGWPSFIALFIAQDLLYYLFHRASHRVRWMWAAHSVHHSSTRMNFSTALRQSPLYPLAAMWAFWLPLAWVGFEPVWIITTVLGNLALQFFVHTTLFDGFGRLSLILNTPSAHRVHHACNARYLDCNYAGVLMIWDHLFGSYIAQDPAEPCRFGTVKPVPGNNPWTVMLAEWRQILSDTRRASGAKQRCRRLFGPPADYTK